jgi:hypothetical protein
MAPLTLHHADRCRSCGQRHSRKNESCAEFSQAHHEGRVTEEIELSGNTTSTRLRALSAHDYEQVTLDTAASWALSYSNGRVVYVCDRHMVEHAQTDTAKPRCDELRDTPWRPITCADCLAGR